LPETKRRVLEIRSAQYDTKKPRDDPKVALKIMVLKRIAA